MAEIDSSTQKVTLKKKSFAPNRPPRHKRTLLFEIDNAIYFFEKILELIIGIVLVATVAIGHFYGDIFEPLKLIGMLFGIYLIANALLRIFRHDKKIKFYSDAIAIERRGGGILELGHSDIKEMYRLPFALFRCKAKRYGIVRSLIAMPLELLLFLFKIVTSALFLLFGRSSTLMLNNIVFIGANDKQVINIPLSMLSKKEIDSIENYLKIFLRTNIETLDESLHFIPLKQKR